MRAAPALAPPLARARPPQNESGNAAGSDAAFERAHEHFKAQGLKLERCAPRATSACACCRARRAARPRDARGSSRARAALRPACARRLAVLEAWAQGLRERAQPAADADEALSRVLGLMPKRIKKKRVLVAADGSDGGWEEYYDYIYPDDQAAQPSLKILEMAHKWKRQRGEGDE